MSSARRILAASSLALSMGAAACGSSSSDSSGPTADGGADGGADAARAPCSEPAESRPAGSSCVKSVTGRLVEDPSGASLSHVTTVCGAGLCLFGTVDANGFSVPVNRFVDLDAFVVHVDGRPTHANVYVRLARQSSDVVTLADAIRVPKLDQVGASLPSTPPAASTPVSAGAVALTLAPSTEVELDFADAALEEEGRKLRSGRVSSETSIDPNLVVLYALAPFGAALKPAAQVAITLPPGANIADGTAVELVALDDTLDGKDLGKLRVVAPATVTGGVAKTDAGSGLDRLTWVGVRKKGT